MSTFDVKIRKIDAIEPHPNADRLDVAVVGGYRAVVQKGTHRIGDLVLYIPTDAVFTNLDIAEKLNIALYLTGKEKNRVKAIRLRGILSEGIVVPFDVVDEATVALGFGYYEHKEGLNLVKELQIEKYEEPIPIEMQGEVRPWPSWVPKYDVENIKRPESLEAARRWLAEEPLICTEKLHGTNMTVAIGDAKTPDERVIVCSRNIAIKENETNVYWRAVRKYHLVEALERLQQEYTNANISLHGEVVGVQDLKYGYTNGDVGFYAFDLMINGEYSDWKAFVDFCNEYNIPAVPVVAQLDSFNYEEIVPLSTGKSRIADHIREGIIVKPYYESSVKHYGERLIFKFINDEYLVRSGKPTEHH